MSFLPRPYNTIFAIAVLVLVLMVLTVILTNSVFESSPQEEYLHITVTGKAFTNESGWVLFSASGISGSKQLYTIPVSYKEYNDVVPGDVIIVKYVQSTGLFYNSGYYFVGIETRDIPDIKREDVK